MLLTYLIQTASVTTAILLAFGIMGGLHRYRVWRNRKLCEICNQQACGMTASLDIRTGQLQKIHLCETHMAESVAAHNQCDCDDCNP